MKIRFLIADDHKIVRDGLHSLIEVQPDIQVIAGAEDGEKAIRLCSELIPDIVIMDISMPGLNGIETTHQIIDTIPGVNIIALSMYSERRFVAGMLKAGAKGYLLKDCAFDELSEAIRVVNSQNMYLSFKIIKIIAQDVLNLLSDQYLLSNISINGEEGKVLQLLAKGRSSEQFASELSENLETV